MTHQTLADGDYENVHRAMGEFVAKSVFTTHEMLDLKLRV